MPPPPRSRGPRAWGPLVLFVLALAGAWAFFSEAGRAVTGRWSFVREAEDRGYAYRWQASFTVLATGEPVEFDVVVPCSVRVTTYKDGDRSVDPAFAMMRLQPFAYARVTREGHALLLPEPGSMCSQSAASDNGDVGPGYLPMVVWYESADDLSFGLAYASQDAYASPLAKLAFRGARVTAASAADYARYREEAARGFVPRGQITSPYGVPRVSFIPGRKQLDPRGSALDTMRDCLHGYVRVRLPEAARAVLRERWPAERPRFWAYPDPAGFDSVLRKLDVEGAAWPGPDQYRRRSGTLGGAMLTHAGDSWIGGRDAAPRVYTALPIYPLDSGTGFHAPTSTSAPPAYVKRLDYRPEMKGFTYCYHEQVHRGPVPEVFELRVNDEVAFRRSRMENGGMQTGVPEFLVERDEFLFIIMKESA